MEQNSNNIVDIRYQQTGCANNKIFLFIIALFILD